MAEPTLEQLQSGSFYTSVIRGNKQIKADRGQQLLEDGEMSFRRKIEDKGREVTRLKRTLVNMLDLSPENMMTLKMADDFNPDEFANRYCSISVDVRNEVLKLNEYKKAYNRLYGGTYEMEAVD
jgi:hypothetical protein